MGDFMQNPNRSSQMPRELRGIHERVRRLGPLVAGAEQTINKGAAGGYAPLGPDGIVPTSYLPSSSGNLREYWTIGNDPLADYQVDTSAACGAAVQSILGDPLNATKTFRFLPDTYMFDDTHATIWAHQTVIGYGCVFTRSTAGSIFQIDPESKVTETRGSARLIGGEFSTADTFDIYCVRILTNSMHPHQVSTHVNDCTFILGSNSKGVAVEHTFGTTAGPELNFVTNCHFTSRDNTAGGNGVVSVHGGVRVSNCSFRLMSIGVYLSGTSVRSSSVGGCEFFGCYRGIYSTGGPVFPTVVQAQITDCSFDSGTFHITIATGAWSITGCHFYLGTWAINADPYAARDCHVAITNCHIYNCTTGVQMVGSGTTGDHTVLLSNSYIFSAGTGAGGNWLDFDTAAANTTSFCHVTNCFVRSPDDKNDPNGRVTLTNVSFL